MLHPNSDLDHLQDIKYGLLARVTHLNCPFSGEASFGGVIRCAHHCTAVYLSLSEEEGDPWQSM